MMNINKFRAKQNSRVNLSKINTYHTGNFSSKKKQKKNLKPDYPKFNSEQLNVL